MADVNIPQLQAALGANAAHYEARFSRIAAAGRRWVPGWNSAAFLHSTAWFFYRRMYGLAILNFLAPWILLFALVFSSGWFAPSRNLDIPAVVLFGAYVGCVFVLVPLFADSIYYRHLLARFAKVRAPSLWTALGATTLVFAQLALFLAMLVPAYGDYTPRAKMSEAILAASGVRTEVTDFYTEHRRLPNAPEAARFSGGEPSTYVHSVAYDAGIHAIVVTLRSPFPGKRFAFRAVEEDGRLSWKCGPIDVDRKHMPLSCRD